MKLKIPKLDSDDVWAIATMAVLAAVFSWLFWHVLGPADASERYLRAQEGQARLLPAEIARIPRRARGTDGVDPHFIIAAPSPEQHPDAVSWSISEFQDNDVLLSMSDPPGEEAWRSEKWPNDHRYVHIGLRHGQGSILVDRETGQAFECGDLKPWTSRERACAKSRELH